MKKPWWKNSRGEWYVIIQFALLALVVFGPRSTSNLSLWPEPWRIICLVAGLVIATGGAMLALMGIRSLGNNLTAVPHPKQNSTLVETGAYRLVRHPIYSGILLGSLGWAIFHRSTLVLIYTVVLFIFFDMKSRREEQWLSAKFGNYADYQRRVRKLIPFLY